MIIANRPLIASKGDLLQHTLQALGMNQKGAAYVGALKDLSCGDLAGYHKNMFEAATGFDPGRLGGAILGSPFGVCSPAVNLARLLGRRVSTGKVRARRSYHTPFGTVQTERRDLRGKGFFGRLKGAILEHRLNTNPLFRARFEAQVGGKYVPDGRNDGKITIRRFKPKFNGIRGIGPRTALGALAQMQSQIAKLVKGLKNKGKGQSAGGIQGKEGSYVSKLGPNASFEDLVAAFMKDVMKEGQKEIKEKMAELNKLKADHEASKKSGNTNKSSGSNSKKSGNSIFSNIIKGAAPFVGAAVGGLLGGPIGAMLGGNILGAVAGSSNKSSASSSSSSGKSDGSLTDKEKEANTEYQNSRQMMMEELKNMMQKLQQMQQALSNVMNAMHQGSMNAVRNIRA